MPHGLLPFCACLFTVQCLFGRENKADKAASKAKGGLNDAQSDGKSAGRKAEDKADQAGREGKDLLGKAEDKAKKVSN